MLKPRLRTRGQVRWYPSKHIQPIFAPPDNLGNTGPFLGDLYIHMIPSDTVNPETRLPFGTTKQVWLFMADSHWKDVTEDLNRGINIVHPHFLDEKNCLVTRYLTVRPAGEPNWLMKPKNTN